MTWPKTLVVILNYQGAEVLFPCVASVLPGLGPGDQILVVDNGQEQELLERVRQRWPSVWIFMSPENQGFSAGMNHGLRRALEEGFEAVWLLNNDAVVAPQALHHLQVAAAEQTGPNLFSPLITEPHGKIWFSGGKINYWRMRTEHDQALPRQITPFCTEFLTGCAIFIPRTTIEHIGCLDERYFLYYEDADYSQRVLRAGGRLWLVPQSRVMHREVSTLRAEKIYWLVRSGVTFFLRSSPRAMLPWVKLFLSLRRFKNWVQLAWKPTVVARELQKAYTDALK